MISPAMTSFFSTTPPTAAKEIAVLVQASEVLSRARPGARPAGGPGAGGGPGWAGRRGSAARPGSAGGPGSGSPGPLGPEVIASPSWLDLHRSAETSTTTAAMTAITVMTAVSSQGMTDRGSGRPRRRARWLLTHSPYAVTATTAPNTISGTPSTCRPHGTPGNGGSSWTTP